MGMNIECMLYRQEMGYLTAEKNKLLDIGPQNVYFCTEQQIRTFARYQGAIVGDKVLNKEARRLEYFLTPRPEERTILFSEIADLTNIKYHAFDVCPAPKTELLDLNFDSLPERHREHYDVVMNFGTTEHIFNQWNCFTDPRNQQGRTRRLLRAPSDRLSRSRLLLLCAAVLQGYCKRQRMRDGRRVLRDGPG